MKRTYHWARIVFAYLFDEAGGPLIPLHCKLFAFIDTGMRHGLEDTHNNTISTPLSHY